jgi:hypothetical protein
LILRRQLLRDQRKQQVDDNGQQQRANLGTTMRTGLITTRNLNAILAGVAMSLAVLPTASQAFTEEDQRRLCMGDVFRLCSQDIPDRERIIACMQRQRTSLSDGCRSVFGRANGRSVSAAATAR